mmetsp:Transcript_32775/g.107926  ORF Transcript_32775/g.107926 Transcript_32775/m.107926 type:complete len:553 (+) Transcript_32775:70-1728(+)
MAPAMSLRLAWVCAVAAAAAASRPAGEGPGVVFIQTARKGSITKAAVGELEHSTAAPGSEGQVAALTELKSEVGDLKSLLLSMQTMLSNGSSGCCNCCQGCASGGETPGGSGVVPPPNEPGLCAAFGDPHFTTFDGAHTVVVREMVMWMVKSDQILIQGLSKTNTGNFMGFAVGGPFMRNHTLAVYNSGLTGDATGKLKVMLDGREILNQWDEKGNAEFEEPFLLWAARRTEWDVSMHDHDVLSIKPSINWAVGPWPKRFQQAPKGGLYYFKLPNEVEITLSGVDYMSAVIKMAPQQGQSGYCGNFNGVAEDEFEPPVPGSVAKVLVPAWNKAVGEGLEQVHDADNLFKLASPELAASVPLVQQASALQVGPEDPMVSPCKDGHALDEAEQACVSIPDTDLRAACIADFCLIEKASAVDDAAMAGVMEERLSDGRVPLFVGHGPCRDVNGQALRAVRTKGVRIAMECQELLREVGAAIAGVVGTQLRTEGTCELVVRPGTDVHDLLDFAPSGGGWVDADLGGGVGDPHGGLGGASFVAGVEKDLSWNCWRLD